MHNLYADRKNGRAEIEQLHPALTDKLEDTYQIMVYQEQVMTVAQEMAGYSMVEADDLRRAMGKKIKKEMLAQEERFIQGCMSQGHTEEVGKEIFGLIEHFAGYGFNRSHSAAYGLVAYQTAYLKAHHPAEYLAALLTATKKDKDRTAVYLNECRQMGIKVLVPDVNESDSDFTVREGRIRFGLSAVRNVGDGVVEKIIEARAKEPFTSLQDFVDRVDVSALNKRTIESLDQGRRLRRLWRSAQRPDHGLRADSRCHARASAQRGHGAVQPVCRRHGSRPGEPHRGARTGVAPEDQARLREGDAGALRLGPSPALDRPLAGGRNQQRDS